MLNRSRSCVFCTCHLHGKSHGKHGRWISACLICSSRFTTARSSSLCLCPSRLWLYLCDNLRQRSPSPQHYEIRQKNQHPLCQLHTFSGIHSVSPSNCHNPMWFFPSWLLTLIRRRVSDWSLLKYQILTVHCTHKNFFQRQAFRSSAELFSWYVFWFKTL